jgi:hypothetical protein
VSAIALLMGLLLLSFLGSLLVGGRSRSAAAPGLPSGVEYLGLGFAVGPQALGLVERQMIVDFEPIVQVALGWLAFVVGLDFGRAEGRRMRPASMVLGVACALLTGAVVAYAVWRMLGVVHVPGLDATGRVLLAGGAGAVGCETTRVGVQWVASRWNAKGPICDLLIELAAADDFAPYVAAGALFALVPSSNLAISLPPAGWFGASLALGALLGTVTALLLRGAEGYAVWGALIGTLLLGVGTAQRFGLCTIFVTFVMGIALAAVSPNRRILRRMVGSTERGVLYPMLLLAGARLDPRPIVETHILGALVALVLLARIAGKIVSGLLVRGFLREARPAGPALGIVLLSSGPVSIATAFVFTLRFPGPVGDTLLVCAVASAIVGELVSTFALKRLLAEAGELTPQSEAEDAPPSANRDATVDDARGEAEA